MKHVNVIRKCIAAFSSVSIVASSMCLPGLSAAVVADSADEQETEPAVTLEEEADVSDPQPEIVDESLNEGTEDPEIVVVEISHDIPPYEAYDNADDTTDLAPVTNIHWIEGNAAKLAWNASSNDVSYRVSVSVYGSDGQSFIGSGEIITNKTSINLRLEDYNGNARYDNTYIIATVEAVIVQDGTIISKSSAVTSSKHLYVVDSYLPAPENVKLIRQNDKIMLTFDFDQNYLDYCQKTIDIIFYVNGLDYYYYPYIGESTHLDIEWNGNKCKIDVTNYINNAFRDYATFESFTNSVDISCAVRFEPNYYSDYTLGHYSETSASYTYFVDYDRLPTPTNTALSYNSNGDLVLSFNYDIEDPFESVSYVSVILNFDGLKSSRWGISLYDDCCMPAPIWNDGTCSVVVNDIIANGISDYILNNEINSDHIDVSCSVILRSTNYSVLQSLESSASNTVSYAVPYDIIPAPTNLLLEYDKDQNIVLSFNHELSNPYEDLYGISIYVYFNGDEVNSRFYYNNNLCNEDWAEPVWTSDSCSIDITDIVNNAYRWESGRGIVDVSCRVCMIPLDESLTRSSMSNESNTITFSKPVDINISDKDYVSDIYYGGWYADEYSDYGYDAKLNWSNAREATQYMVELDVYDLDHETLLGTKEIITKSLNVDVKQDILDMLDDEDRFGVVANATIYAQKVSNGVIVAQSNAYLCDSKFVATCEQLTAPTNVTLSDDYVLTFEYSISELDKCTATVQINFYDPENMDNEYNYLTDIYIDLNLNNATWENGVCTVNLKDFIDNRYISNLDMCHSMDYYIACKVQFHRSDDGPYWYSYYGRASEISAPVLYSNRIIDLPQPANVTITDNCLLKFDCDLENAEQVIDYVNIYITLQDINENEYIYDYHNAYYRYLCLSPGDQNIEFDSGIFTIDLKDTLDDAFKLMTYDSLRETAKVWCTVTLQSSASGYTEYSQTSDFSNMVICNSKYKILPAPAKVSLNDKGEISLITGLNGIDTEGLRTHIDILVNDETRVLCNLPLTSWNYDNGVYKLDFSYDFQYEYESWLINVPHEENDVARITCKVYFGFDYTNDIYSYYGYKSDCSNALIYGGEAPRLEFAITDEPADYTGAIGETALFSVVAAGEGLSYQWQVNKSGTWKNTTIAGNKTSVLPVEISAARDGMKFRCVITDSNNKQIISREATLNVTTGPAIISNPENYSGAIGDKATFTIEAEGNDITYQWQVFKSGTWKNTFLAGNKTSSLSVDITAARDGMIFRCVVTDADGKYVASAPATLTALAAPSIITQPNDYSGRIGETATFSIRAQGEGLTYQWQVYKSGTWKNTSLTGNTTDTLKADIISTRDGMKFRCVVKNINNLSVTSEEVTLTVVQGPVINTQPADTSGITGDKATFSIEAAGEGLSYQWQVLKSGIWKNTSLTGNKTDTLIVDILDSRDGMTFRCVVKDINGITVYSTEAVLTVIRAPEIIMQPCSFSGAIDEIATFSIEAEGEDLTYQWQVFKSGNWKNTSLSGNKEATLIVPVIASRDGMTFRCVVTNGNGVSVTSDEVTLNIVYGPEIVSQPEDYTGFTGDTATFSIIAEGEGLEYQWQVFKNNAWKNTSLTGNTTSTLYVPVIESRDGMTFRCVVTDASGNSAISDEVILTVDYGPNIVTQPENYLGTTGTTATFSIVAEGDNLKYQWQVYKNGNWKNTSLTGNTTSTLDVPVIESRDGMTFRCVVTDASGNTSISDEVSITVVPVPLAETSASAASIVDSDVSENIDPAEETINTEQVIEPV